MSITYTRDICLLYEDKRGDLVVTEYPSEDSNEFEYNLFIENAYLYYSIDFFINYSKDLFRKFERFLNKQINLKDLVSKEIETVKLGEVSRFLEIEEIQDKYYVDVTPPRFKDLPSLYLWFKVFIDNIEDLVSRVEVKVYERGVM